MEGILVKGDGFSNPVIIQSRQPGDGPALSLSKLMRKDSLTCGLWSAELGSLMVATVLSLWHPSSTSTF